MSSKIGASLALFALVCPNLCAGGAHAATPWVRHAIDDTSEGADGARLADVNGDGLPDIAAAWEEGGVVRAYLHPGTGEVRKPWPYIEVGRVNDPEDAVFADMDGDGHADVISACEGGTRRVHIHWAPKSKDGKFDAESYSNPALWQTETLPASDGQQQWMYLLPMQVDGEYGLDIVAAGKNEGAALGWFRAPENPRDMAGWTWHPIMEIGWVMSIESHDMNSNGLPDIVISNRREPNRGIWWFEHPGYENAAGQWKGHLIGGAGYEVMFLTVVPAVSGGGFEIFCATRGDGILHLTQNGQGAWIEKELPMPPHAGTGKSVAVGALLQPASRDLVLSCENAHDRPGLWLYPEDPGSPHGWGAPIDIGGEAGVKYDKVELVDMNQNGLLDVLTCEEHDELGVVWYENPGH